ncbi:hypothetical protein BST85_12855 [Aureitalea marina]|uniref:Serine aminopeptidase S33 domain-containing protein n=2 Tax=Aureitalea marina TaxID=930804 RepID=A0A2S7KTW5_9FLAO|nr:hypothetical protein BST85_12855 [Aureitalea marina]
MSACAVKLPSAPPASNTLGLTTESELVTAERQMEIEELYETGEEGTFSGADDISIYYKVFRQSTKDSPAILISAGRTEAAIKYKELIFDLYRLGYSVYIHDHRGQGLSGRMLDDPDMGYVADFQDYIEDMRQFYQAEIQPSRHSAVFLIAHSMGGAIGMTYLQQFPSDFQAAAFSSPMLGLPTGACGGTNLLIGKEPKYALGQGPYQEPQTAFKKNKLTGSEIRYNRMVEAFTIEPKARLGGTSYHWVKESCEQFDYMNDNIGKIETPFLIFSAANEQIVREKAHQEFIEEARELDKICYGYRIANAQHELLIEKDPQRIQVINQMHWFFKLYQKN